MATKIINAINTLLRVVSVFLLRAYQLILSPFLGGQCRFYPTCSDYAITVFTRFNFFYACWLTLWRLLRCHPLCKGGEDLPPPKSSSKP